MPDVHSGYGFAIGNVAAFDMDDPQAIVSPGGVGFDINCGVRLIRTNLTEEDVEPVKEALTQSLFDHIPVGVGGQGIIPTTMADLEAALEMGVDWSLRRADVSLRAKKRGLPQMGTLGAGNHYAGLGRLMDQPRGWAASAVRSARTQIEVVEEIFDEWVARKMGIDQKGQVCVMIHSGSRGLGHQVATDALIEMERAMARDRIAVNDRQLACARIGSREGAAYLAAMAAAANYAWVNRSSMTFLARQAFAKTFGSTPDDLDMALIYDVSHNIAKAREQERARATPFRRVEEHTVDGRPRRLLVHRKGSTRAFPPHHPLIPLDYQATGQPVLIGGTMGTCSYVLTGTDQGFKETFGSTCHGAGRARSRHSARSALDYREVLDALKAKGVAIRVASPSLVMEEAPESYKDVSAVVETCHAVGISKKAVKLRPIGVVKG
ncbi:hypothetical protein MNEG_5458 [Monoraphidium neglectum]|uniref:3'-phosphate/5'-hydroxy nucleic acid ligase n=1 Tax=Monoraphidium neglectum TaxID=145388 RepID=A0A0D2JUF1_9CHLO|nr:hypothetical protein MNEG_5458 [Monoraphidium neglectum]KIZ02498.1 hypothetical protein MNEG_5458 [Monoraphidium neglectum]|eukprot:XP_013901517.1 hypothetical protein MNEG_5458 [Monoraphidium neglectum]